MQRRTGIVAVVLAAGLVAGCGDGGGGSAGPAPSAARRMTVSSPAFTDGSTIPRRYTCDGDDVSPPLAFASVPAEAEGLALLVQDPDAPHGTFTHWLVWNADPRQRSWAAGKPPRGAVQGRNGFKKEAYGGPCPPKGTPHRYVFSVYATDRPLDLGAGASAGELTRALEGRTLASGTVTGRYGR